MKDLSEETWKGIALNVRFAWGLSSLRPDGDQLLSPEERLHEAQLMAAAAPDFYFAVSNLSTIDDEKARTAESLLNVELSGVFPGIMRESVAGFGFVRRDDGRWEAVRQSAFAGPAVP